VNLAIYKVRRFLREGLRLRTACDLQVDGDLRVTAPAGRPLLSEEEALKAAQTAIGACAKAGLFATPPITELTTTVVRKERKDDGAKGAAEAAEPQE